MWVRKIENSWTEDQRPGRHRTLSQQIQVCRGDFSEEMISIAVDANRVWAPL